ncbi:MAG: TIGR00341 family protein [Cyanobacteria bacterium P01_A01_bin.84]
MSLRLLEVYLPEEKSEQMEELLAEYSYLEMWKDKNSDRSTVRILLYSNQVEVITDFLVKKYTHIDSFQMLLLPVEAMIPRPEPLEETADPEDTTSRVNREEIYARVTGSINFSWTELSMVLLSSAIACVGLVQGSEAVIIGAMVLAPLLKPNMALAVAATLGDVDLVFKTIKLGFLGILAGLIFSIFVGWCFPISPDLPEIAFRTRVSLPEIIVALASGSAAAISLTTGERNSIVGVMVSVALLPPLVTWGMLLGSGEWEPAGGAMLLVLVNIASLNIAAIATLLIQKVSPMDWWGSIQAKKLTKITFGFWALILALLVSLVFIFQFRNA